MNFLQEPKAIFHVYLVTLSYPKKNKYRNVQKQAHCNNKCSLRQKKKINELNESSEELLGTKKEDCKWNF